MQKLPTIAECLMQCVEYIEWVGCPPGFTPEEAYGQMLRDCGKALENEVEAAAQTLKLLKALRLIHARVLEYAKERDPDQLGTWDAIFAEVKPLLKMPGI